jgi:hypothetical protein
VERRGRVVLGAREDAKGLVWRAMRDRVSQILDSLKALGALRRRSWSKSKAGLLV